MDSYHKLRIRRYTIITTKYVLATLLSIHIAYWVGVIDFLSACYVAVLTLQPNLYRGISYSWELLKLTTVAVAITVAIVWTTYGDLHNNWWIYQTALSMGLIVLYSLWQEHQQGMIIGTFTVAYVTCLTKMIPDQQFFDMVHIRYLTILIGIATATLINYGSALFRYRDRPYLRILSVLKDLENVITRIIKDQDSTETQPDEKYLTWFQPVFKKLQQLEQDLDELRVEWLEWNLSPTEPVERYQRLQTVLYGLKNTAHYIWSNLLWNTHHGQESNPQWHEILETAQAQLRACQKSIETEEPERLSQTLPTDVSTSEKGPPREELRESLENLGNQTARLINHRK